MPPFKHLVRNKWFWISASLLLLFALYAYFFRFPLLEVHPVEAISNEAAFIVDCKPKQLSEHQTTNPFLRASVTFIEKLNESFAISDRLETKDLSIAGFINPQKGIDALYVFNHKINHEKIPSGLKISSSGFKGIPVHHCKNKNISFSYTVYKNLLLVSPKAFIVEDAIRQLEDKHSNLFNKTPFNKVWNKLGNRAAQLYLNIEKISEGFQDAEAFKNTVGIQQLLEHAPWIATDLQLEQLALGYDTPPPSEENIEGQIPDDVLAYFRLKLDFSISQAFDWAKQEATLVLSRANKSTWQEHISLLVPFKDEAKAKQQLLEFAEREGSSPPISYLNQDIYRLPQTQAFDFLFSKKHIGLNKAYFSILEKHILFSSQLAPHRLYLDKIASNQTLSNSLEYLQFKEKHLSKGETKAFLSEKEVYFWLESNIREDLFQALFNKEKRFSLVSLFPEKDKRFQIKKSISSNAQSDLKVVWKQQLDSDLLQAPKFIYPPHLKQYFVLAQDNNKQLYCFDNLGNLRWKKQLEQAILSDFFLVDYAKNKQFQILFNTENNIHLLDFKGKVVGRYPVQFRSKASNGLICFDMDKHNNFVYFLAGKNKKIYGYELNGRPLNGWNPKTIRYPIQSNGIYFFDKKKDYINFLDTKNHLLSFDLKGKPHFEALNLGKHIGSLAFDLNQKSKRFVVAKSNGKLKITNLLGKGFNLASQPKDKVNDFSFEDITGDNRKDYVLLAGQQLIVSAYDAEDKFVQHIDYTFDMPQDHVFTFVKKGNTKAHIAVLDKTNKQINVISADGKPSSNFPIEASFPFDITHADKGLQYIIVGKDKEIIALQF